MVGIQTVDENLMLATIDQMDLLGLTNRHRGESLDWLRKRVKNVLRLLHPDKQVSLPSNVTAKLPYKAIHATAIAEYLSAGIINSKTQQPADDLILFRFWQKASVRHRVRWRPFDDNDQLRSIQDAINDTGLSTHDSSHGVQGFTPGNNAYWTGERARRPDGCSQRQDTTSEPTVQHDEEHTPSPSATDDREDEISEPSANEPLTPTDELIRRVAATFPIGKLYNLAADKDGRRFVFARTRLRKRNGKERWALVAANLTAANRLRLTLVARDINTKGHGFDQKLHQGSSISWERMIAGGYFGLGRFRDAKKDDVLKFALQQQADNGAI